MVEMGNLSYVFELSNAGMMVTRKLKVQVEMIQMLVIEKTLTYLS